MKRDRDSHPARQGEELRGAARLLRPNPYSELFPHELATQIMARRKKLTEPSNLALFWSNARNTKRGVATRDAGRTQQEGEELRGAPRLLRPNPYSERCFRISWPQNNGTLQKVDSCGTEPSTLALFGRNARNTKRGVATIDADRTRPLREGKARQRLLRSIPFSARCAENNGSLCATHWPESTLSS